MPGCGKSTLARALAAAGLCDVADLDTAVERRAGMSVARIMATLGEPAFRRMEAEALAEVTEGAGGTLPLVVSTGGGVPCHGDNMDRMLAAGTVVWLQSGAERTVQRLAEAPGPRPTAPWPRGVCAGGTTSCSPNALRPTPAHTQPSTPPSSTMSPPWPLP